MAASLIAVVYALVIAASLAYVVIVVRAGRLLPMASALVAASAGLAGSSAPLLVSALQARAPVVDELSLVSGTFLLGGCVSLGVRIAAPKWRPRRLWLLLGIEPAIVVLGAVTNSRYHLLVPDPDVIDVAAAVHTPALLGGVHVVYLLALTLAAVAFIGRQLWRRRVPGWRAGLALLAALLPLLTAVASAVSLAADRANDAALPVVSVAAVLFLGGLIHGVFRLVPLARASIVDTIDDAITVLDVDRTVVAANPAAQAMVARLAPHVRQLPGASLSDIAPTLELPAAGTSVTVEFADRERNEYYDVRVTALRGRRGAVMGWTLVARDVTAIRRQQRALEESNRTLSHQLETIEALRHDLAEQASRDALTGLHNRRYLMEYLAAGARDGSSLTLAVVDVDHFKRVNDEYGHQVGDAALRAVAAALAAGMDVADGLARYGGEEFVCVFPGRSLEDGVAKVEELRRTLAATPIEAGGVTLTVTFSAGVASGSGTDPDDLLTRADRALYRAKAAGRNQVQSDPVLISSRDGSRVGSRGGRSDD